MRLAGDADFTADEPGDLGVEVDGARLHGRGGGEEDGKGDGIFVAEVHERADGQAAGSGKEHRTGGEAGGQRPVDVRRIASVAGVEPVDVPLLLHGEYQAGLQGAAGSDGGAEADQLRGEVLGFNRAWAAVADGGELSAAGRCEEEKSEEQKEQGEWGRQQLAEVRQRALHHTRF